jgi:hypothetical protein
MAHYVSNRGKLLLAQGAWDDDTAALIRIGLCSGASVPATVDTQIEINPLNFVSDFLALGSVVEANFTNYARQNLTRTPASEDDGNNRINLDASDVVIANAGGAVNNTLWGGFVFEFITNDAASPFISLFTFASTITTNGSNLTFAIADLYRIS